MTLAWTLLVLLLLLTLVQVAIARLASYEFTFGKRWIGIPFKMAYAALSWPMTVLGLGTSAAGLVLTLLFPTYSAGWCLSGVILLLSTWASFVNRRYIRRVTAPHRGFEQAFGPDWQAKLPPIVGVLRRRWTPGRYPERPVRLKRDEVIWTFPETERQLLADLWQPAQGTTPTGVAFLFFHGSAWHFNDKAVGTDPMCRHLAAQGHVVVDVAYRLAPEVDLTGMVTDVKRAVAWVKQNAKRLGVDPKRIVVGGASAGAHIALLATYGGNHPAYSPADLKGADTRVAGVVSLYGPSDMRAYLEHHAGRMSTTGKRVTERAVVPFDGINAEQMMFNLFGGMPDEVPAAYDLADVKTHVRPGAPPALILQGEYDFIVPAQATRKLVERLQEARVPVVYVELPQTEHAWDVGTGMTNMVMRKQIIPASLDSQYAPPTQATIYDIERFLAYLAI